MSDPSKHLFQPKNSLVPYVIEDTGRGERSMDIYSRLLKDRIIFIGQEITDHVANIVIAQLLFLRMEDPKKPINIYINSPGGYIAAGLAIYDTMKHMSSEVYTWCIGMAASMGAVLLAAGTKRHALPHSRVMIHQPVGGVGGTSAEVLLQANEILQLKKIMHKIMAENTNQPIEKIAKESERDFWMSADEAKDYGIIDEIVFPKKSQKGKEKE